MVGVSSESALLLSKALEMALCGFCPFRLKQTTDTPNPTTHRFDGVT